MVRQILETFLYKDNQHWIIYEDCWKIFWGDKKKSEDYDVELLVEQNKGFIILLKYKEDGYVVKDIKKYIKFAFVYSKFRRQGIMKKLIKKLEQKYAKDSLSLYSVNKASDKVWQYFGFTCVSRSNYDGYVLRK